MMKTLKTTLTTAQLQNSLRRARAAFDRHVGWNHGLASRFEARVYHLERQLEARDVE